ncbi:MAG: cytochrome c biogenesis protein ResB [Thermomicrobiales bacterium]|nr:cytochrome c biogenesis protein ResB [Thermomicrobiales bacterium]
MTEATLTRPQRVRRSWPEIAVDRVWRFFCSVRAAVVEITILALLVLAGTLRGSSVPQSLADVLPVTAPLVERWYAWDVFRSLPFAAILTLLSVAIAICTINRAPGIWQAIAHPTVTTTHGFLRNAETSTVYESALSRDDFTAELGRILGKSHYRVLSAEHNGETHLYADRWRYSRLATFPFHLALIMILFGGIVGAAWGFRENELFVPEGSVRDLGHGTGISVRLNDFSEVYREDGSPAIYRSDITLLRNGQEIDQGSMTVNNPFTHGDIVFYQSGFGQAVSLRIADSNGNVVLDDSLPLGPFQSRLNPDAPAARIDLPQAGVALSVVAPDVNPANQPQLDTLNLKPGEMFFMIRPLGTDSPISQPIPATVKQGDSVTLGDLTLTFERERRFSVLQVARNPGIPIFFVAAILLIGGSMVTFYFPHRRLRGIIADTPTGSVARLAPIARRDWSATRVFDQLVERISTGTGLTPQVTRREAASG